MEKVYRVEDMMCSHCKAAVEKACLSVAGVTAATVDLKAKTVTVQGAADAEQVKAAIRAAGFRTE